MFDRAQIEYVIFKDNPVAIMYENASASKANSHPMKGIQDSLNRLEFWIQRYGFRILCFGFQSLLVERGFWMPNVSGILVFLSYSGF